MARRDGLPYNGDRAVLATMHGKERVVAPLLERFLGLNVEVAVGLDTDAFGTFSRDVARTGSQLDAARRKIRAAFEIAPDARVGISSEGSFGPHPFIPYLPLGQEIVVSIDQVSEIELVGQYAGPDTNFAHAVVSNFQTARSFAERIGFPGHGAIVSACVDEKPAPEIALVKDVPSWDALERAIGKVTGDFGVAFVEADMRAHRNPTRMRAIKRATLDLVRRTRSLCPACGRPGFVATERLAGLPCSWCGEPTLLTKAEVMICEGCNHRRQRDVQVTVADPGNCSDCNP